MCEDIEHDEGVGVKVDELNAIIAKDIEEKARRGERKKSTNMTTHALFGLGIF